MAGTSRLVKLLYKSLLKSYTTYESYFDADPPRRLMTQLQTSLSGGRPGLASDRLPGNVERLPISSIDIVRLSFRANMDKTDPVVRTCDKKVAPDITHLSAPLSWFRLCDIPLHCCGMAIQIGDTKMYINCIE
jgi:hypothetical protein